MRVYAWYGDDFFFAMKYYLDEDSYVNISIEKDSTDADRYIIKHFGDILSLFGNRSFDLSATFNHETGKLEIPPQPLLPVTDQLHPACDLVNVNDHSAPITLFVQQDGNVGIDDWAALYADGEYYYKGTNSVLKRPNAVMEWIHNIDQEHSKQMREYVRVEQDSNSSELRIANFCNRGKRIDVILVNNSDFNIPKQLVSHFEDWVYFDDYWDQAPAFDHYGYLCSLTDDEQSIPITGKWTPTTMITSLSWKYGYGSYSSSEEPFTLTMLSDNIVSPFITIAPGDVNSDGKINVSDVTALINMIMGITSMDEACGDVNGDGKVNVSDVSALINIILGIK